MKKEPSIILKELISMPSENEVVEFKSAKNQFDFTKLGRYFSALSNEANLANCSFGWLVFGVDAKHRVTGTAFRRNPSDLNSLKHEIANKTTNRITFSDILEVEQDGKRVLLFQIPAAPKGIPVAFDGHYYGREHESLGPLNLNEIEGIRSQALNYDWSAQIIESASISDLDPLAIQTAKQNYLSKFPEKVEESKGWSDKKFLDKIKITRKGKITNAAIVLLGKDESEHLISPSVAKIRWVLKDSDGNSKDYLILSCPLILAVDKIYSRIRNLKYRYLKQESLFPDEVDQYEPYTIREALNNCIAHQDYELNGRINVVESDDQLIFSNLGRFIPASVEAVVSDDTPEEYYRNPFLANAMFNIKMVDTAGGGIRKMFNSQRKRFFPLPEYDLSSNRVKVTIIGKILDLDYAMLLAQNQSLTIEEIILLDKVQKHKTLSEDQIAYLKSQKLIEGRKPNFFISKKLAQKTGQKSTYTKNRAFEKKYYLDLILKGIEQHGSLSRKDVDDLILQKLPDWMTAEQRKNKVNNLLSELRRKKKIENIGTLKVSKWVLIKDV